MDLSFRLVIDPAESERFGFKCARAYNVTANDFEDVVRFCQEHDVNLLTIRCDVSELAAVHAFEEAGCRLMDTLVYYSRNTKTVQDTIDGGAEIRPIDRGEEDDVKEIAKHAFKNYIDHYHSDPRLDNEQADEAFASWAFRSCTDRSVADEVLVAVEEQEVFAFATMRLNDSEEGEGVLFAASRTVRRRGTYGRLISHGINWCKDKGAKRMIVSTQINNYGVQRVWVKQGFFHYKSFYTFHKWFS